MKRDIYNRKLFGMLCIAMSVLLVAGCGRKTQKTYTRVTESEAGTEGTAKETETQTVEATEYVRLDVVNNKEGIEVRILDKENKRITDIPFTVCLVKQEGDPILDKEQSATITGEEYSDEDEDGVISIESVDNGLYEIYLRPVQGYLNANPVPLSRVVYKYDENIAEKIKQADEVDAWREDKSYQADNGLSQEELNAQREKALKVSNILNSGFIRGTSEKFTVNVPEYDENDNIMYEKLNRVEADASLDLSDYIKDNNKEELLISGEKRTAYVYEESRFDKRVEDYYVSKAIIKEDGKNYIYTLVPRMTTSEENVYVGWYSRKGKHYYNDENGYPVTGWKKLDGLWYYFDRDGRKASVTGIDISEYQEEIDWTKLKEAGIDFVIIRCGYRGYETGVLVEDSRFKENIQKATEVGMPFGVYIFSQAISAQEAAEEASMILELSKGYEPTLPFAIDIEACGDSEVEGRQNSLSAGSRTQIINTFVNVIENQGEEAMLYSNKNWLDEHIKTEWLTCKIWYAMWPGETEGTSENDPNGDALEADPDKIPDRDVEIWQYSSKGVVDGIEPLVDLNAWIPSAD